MKENEYLTKARKAMEEDKTDDAMAYYQMAIEENPNDCLEAKFLVLFTKITRDPPTECMANYNVLTKSMEEILVNTANSQKADATEKLEMLQQICNLYIKLPTHVRNVELTLADKDPDPASGNRRKNMLGKFLAQGMRDLHKIGDVLETIANGDKEILKIAIVAWNAGIEFQRKYLYLMKEGKELSQKQIEKIMKIDPSYQPPKETNIGCISPEFIEGLRQIVDGAFGKNKKK